MLNCKCFNEEDRPFRQKFQARKEQQQQKSNEVRKSAPLTMRLLNAVGLRQYIFNKYIFRKLDSKYRFVQLKGPGSEMRRIFCIGNDRQSPLLDGYDIRAEVLRQRDLCVPVLLLQSKSTQNRPYIIYSHGNSSDIADAYLFFSKMVKLVGFNVVIYDYSGYGISRAETTENSICEDLELVIGWLGVPKWQIILWGFSLGTFPTVTAAARGNFAAVVLQSPIASAACFFDNEPDAQTPQGKPQKSCYDFDCLDNLQNVGRISSHVLIMHSSADEIIPIAHAYKLYNNIKASKNAKGYLMLQVEKLKHNQMHYYLSETKANVLSSAFQEYLEGIERQVQQQAKHGGRVRLAGSIRKKEASKKPTKQEEEEWHINEDQEQRINMESEGLVGVKSHKVYFALKTNAHHNDDTAR